MLLKVVTILQPPTTKAAQKIFRPSRKARVLAELALRACSCGVASAFDIRTEFHVALSNPRARSARATSIHKARPQQGQILSVRPGCFEGGTRRVGAKTSRMGAVVVCFGATSVWFGAASVCF
ncbi:MAG: hypothetical protein QM790_09235 [Nibricoccus sp.]